MHTSGLNSRAFEKYGFFNLIDPRGKLNYATRQFYWEEFVVSCSQDLEFFYRTLEIANPTTLYIKKSINHRFHFETAEVSKKEAWMW